jgi:hypothetical protein
MFFRKYLATVLIILLSGAGFITLCPGDDGEHSSLHFITQHCAMHDCERSAPPDTDHSGSGHHRSQDHCGDRAIVSGFPASDTITIQVSFDCIADIVPNIFNSTIQHDRYPGETALFIPPFIVQTTVLLI